MVFESLFSRWAPSSGSKDASDVPRGPDYLVGGLSPDGPADSESSSEYDPFADYGDDKLARAVQDPDRVRDLLEEGEPVSSRAIFAAIEFKVPETLRILANAGGDVNARSENTNSHSDDVPQEQQSLGNDYRYDWERGRDQWYPIVAAAYLKCSADQRDEQATLITTLLDAGADVFAKYQQPIVDRISRASIYPGDPAPKQTDTDDKIVSYGVRSVINALLEDGMRVDPILGRGTVVANVDHVDPMGRTVFLSMCRSACGADAPASSVIFDAKQWTASKRLGDSSTSAARPSLFDAILNLSPNVLAVDLAGKHALHHLLESRDDVNYDSRPPKIKTALLNTFKQCPSLINQPDKAGDYPLHAALQRIRFYALRDIWKETEDLHCLIDDMLAGGADPRTVDGRGNTALHYTADEGLGEVILGGQTRRRFELFTSLGVDVNARNSDGRTALELFLDDDGARALRRNIHYSTMTGLLREWVVDAVWDRDGPTHSPVMRGEIPLASPEMVDEEVFRLFDKAGVNWRGVDALGRTPLHLVARHKSNPNFTRYAAWAERLLTKGVDPNARDKEQRTAADVARESENDAVLEVLEAAAK